MATDPDAQPYNDDYELNPEFYDIAWDKLPKPEKNGGLAFSNTQERTDWIVRLEFTQHGIKGDGSGFYVNIPHPTHHIIFTAGHNLVGVKKEELQLYPDPTGTLSKELTFHVAATYEKDPTEKHAEDDYGIIMVKKGPNGYGNFGFGFALKLSHDKLDEVDLSICGYRELETHPPTYASSESTGKCIICRPQQLEYDVKTRKGWSGAPVIMAYKQLDTVIGIHNYGPKRPGKGSRGTRLTEKVLGEIYGWLNIGHYGKALQSFKPSPNTRESSLYLAFTQDSKSALVRLGYQSDRVTKFDILPAYAPPSSYKVPNDIRYAFRLGPRTGAVTEKRWVLWDAVTESVSLTDTLHEFCVVKLVNRKIGEKDENGPWYIVIEVTNDQGATASLKELRMSASDLTEKDILVNFRETAEVSFASNMRGNCLYGRIPSMPKLHIAAESKSKRNSKKKEERFDYNLFQLYSE